MLTFSGTKTTKFCDGLNRRDFLTVGALGMSGVTLADMLRLQARGAASPAPKAVIMVLLMGGPSHIDMYDLKPDAPAEFRGEFKPIATNVPGMDICEHMPLQAKIADKLALIRGLKTSDTHEPYVLLTGIPIVRGDMPTERDWRPAFGSVVSRLRGGGSMPPYVGLGTGLEPGTKGGSVGKPVYLGAAHRAFVPSGAVFDDLKLRRDMTLDQLADRASLLRSFDTLRRDLDGKGELAGMDAFTTRAMDLLTTNKIRDAFDLSKEPDKVKGKYGAGATSFLQARRLVESGVSVVTLGLNPPGPSNAWDTHSENFKTLRRAMPVLDQAVYALVTDLHERGLQDDVAVVVWGEMGRAPRIGKVPGIGGDGNTPDGRHHWTNASFALLAGGGLKMGQVIGDTGPRAKHAKGRVYTPANVLASLYGVLGIDPTLALPDHSGRPLALLDDPEKIQEL